MAAVVVSLVFGRPAWLLARSQLRRQKESTEAAEERAEVRKLAAAVARVLAGSDNPDEIPYPTKENPSIKDLLHDLTAELSATQSEVAIVRHMFEEHIRDGHGGRVPPWLLRK